MNGAHYMLPTPGPIVLSAWRRASARAGHGRRVIPDCANSRQRRVWDHEKPWVFRQLAFAQPAFGRSTMSGRSDCARPPSSVRPQLKSKKREEKRNAPHHDGDLCGPQREQQISLAHDCRNCPLRGRFRRTALFGEIEPQLGPAMVLGPGLPGFQNQNQRHQYAEKTSCLEGRAWQEGQPDHDAEDGERGEAAGAKHCFVRDTAYLFHDPPPRRSRKCAGSKAGLRVAAAGPVLNTANRPLQADPEKVTDSGQRQKGGSRKPYPERCVA
jgi:hypothetical protein